MKKNLQNQSEQSTIPINLLFLGNPNEIHDLKWGEYLSKLYSRKIFFQTNSKINPDFLTSYGQDKLKNIVFLEPLPFFSLSRLFRLYKGIRILRKNIKQNQINLLQISFATPHALWALFVNIKYIITFHGSDLLVVLQNLINNNKSFKYRILLKLFKKNFSKAVTITFASEHLNNKFIELFNNNDNLHIIRSGIDIELVENKTIETINYLPQSINNFIFFPRMIGEVYDTYLQIEAIELLPKHIIENYYFIFVAYHNSDYANKVLNKLKELEQSKNLKFKFYSLIDQKQMFYLMKKSSLIVMTPRSDGTPSTALEAMALKKPLIISDLNYDKELFDNATLRLKNRTPKDLAILIEEALRNYPNELIEKAYNNVIRNGNIIIEMEKLKEIQENLIR